jgi:hypothetical protein
MMQIQTQNPQIDQLLQLISQFMSSGTMSIVVVTFIQYLKQSPLAPRINEETTKINKLLGVVLAFLTSIGIAYTYNAGTVVITFTVAAVLHGLWHFVQQLALQHVIYHGVFKPTTVQVSAAAPAAVAINPPVADVGKIGS